MSQNIGRSSRRKSGAPAMPVGETLDKFDTYPEAQNLVHTLIAHDVKASALSIVGNDVNVVERVTGTVGYGRAALSSAMSGSWFGLIAGLVFVVVSPDNFAAPIVAGVLIGAGIGMLVGIVVFSSSKTLQKRYRSAQNIIASSYRVVVDHSESAKAHTALAEHKSHGGD